VVNSRPDSWGAKRDERDVIHDEKPEDLAVPLRLWQRFERGCAASTGSVPLWRCLKNRSYDSTGHYRAEYNSRKTTIDA